MLPVLECSPHSSSILFPCRKLRRHYVLACVFQANATLAVQVTLTSLSTSESPEAPVDDCLPTRRASTPQGRRFLNLTILAAFCRFSRAEKISNMPETVSRNLHVPLPQGQISLGKIFILTVFAQMFLVMCNRLTSMVVAVTVIMCKVWQQNRKSSNRPNLCAAPRERDLHPLACMNASTDVVLPETIKLETPSMLILNLPSTLFT